MDLVIEGECPASNGSIKITMLKVQYLKKYSNHTAIKLRRLQKKEDYFLVISKS